MKTIFKSHLTYVLKENILQFKKLYVDINWLSCVQDPKQVIEALTMLRETINHEVGLGNMSHQFTAGPMAIKCVRIEEDKEEKFPGFCLPWSGIKYLQSDVGLEIIEKILIGLKVNFTNLEKYNPKEKKNNDKKTS